MEDLLNRMRFDIELSLDVEKIEEDIVAWSESNKSLEKKNDTFRIILNSKGEKSIFNCPLSEANYEKINYILTTWKDYLKEGDYISYKIMTDDIFMILEIEKNKNIDENEGYESFIINKDGKIIDFKGNENLINLKKIDRDYINRYKLKDIYQLAEGVDLLNLYFIEEYYDKIIDYSKLYLKKANAFTDILYKMNKEVFLSSDERLTTQVLCLSLIEGKLKEKNICDLSPNLRGILAFMPLYVVHEKEDIPKERLYRASVFSYLVTEYTSLYLGGISKYCSMSICEAIGSTCGILYMKGYDLDHMNLAIKIIYERLENFSCKNNKRDCTMKSIIIPEIIFTTLEIIYKTSDVYGEIPKSKRSIEEVICDIGLLIG